MKLDDVVRNTPLVLKLVVNYNRQHQIHSTPDEMELLDINLSTKDSSFFSVVQSPVSGFNNKYKKSCESIQE